MGQHFFSGGSLGLETDRWLDGTHYQRPAAAWRQKLESRRREVLHVLRRHYGSGASIWYHRWRLCSLACEELLGYDGGRELGDGHFRLRRAGVPPPVAA